MSNPIPELIDNRTPAERRGDPGARAVAKTKRAKRGSLDSDSELIVEAPNKITQAHKDLMFRAKEVFIENAETAALGVVADMSSPDPRVRLEARRIVLERALGKPEAAPAEQMATPKSPIFNIFIGGKPAHHIDGIITDSGTIIVED